MARFLHLSETVINLEAVRLIYPHVAKPKAGETNGCTVYFTSSPAPYCFYGNDAEKILAAAHSSQVAAEEIHQ